VFYNDAETGTRTIQQYPDTPADRSFGGTTRQLWDVYATSRYLPYKTNTLGKVGDRSFPDEQ
jgi:hypothetical protein